MESLFRSSNRNFNENIRRVNNAIFISKDRSSSEDSEAEDSDSCSIVSNLTDETPKSWSGLVADDSDSSTSTLISKLLPKRKEYDPEAYQKWLKAKNEVDRKRKDKELKRKKLDDNKKKLAEEKRRQESEEKLKRWMERKEQETQMKKYQAENGNEKKEKSSKLKKKWIPNEESETTFKAWQNRVKQQEEERKYRQQAEQRIQEELKQERQYVSKLFYDDWLKSSSSKPKPVPLNQGIDSLRGSISKMFINPVPWKSNVD